MGHKATVVHTTSEVASETAVAYRAYASTNQTPAVSQHHVHQTHNHHHTHRVEHHEKSSIMSTHTNHSYHSTEVASDTVATYMAYKQISKHPMPIQSPVKYQSSEVPAETIAEYRAMHQTHAATFPSLEDVLHPQTHLLSLNEQSSGFASSGNYSTSYSYLEDDLTMLPTVIY